MPKLVDEHTFVLYKEGMRDMRDTLGRRILVKLSPILQSCPNCSWDDANQCSSGIYEVMYPYPAGVPGPKEFRGRCPICKGKGKISIAEQVKRVKGQISWLEGEEKEITVGGITYDVDVEASNVDVRFYELFEKAQSFIIDDLEVTLAFKPLKEGLRDLIKFTAYFKLSGKSNG